MMCFNYCACNVNSLYKGGVIPEAALLSKVKTTLELEV